MPQLISEGVSPGVLYDGHPRSKLDHYSENYILTYSYYMDTRTDPAAVLTNPGRSTLPPSEELFLQTERLLNETLPPDTHYVRYWMGFRMYVRPLLAMMNYMDIRQCIQWGFFLLLGAVSVMLYRQTKSALITLAFFAAISQLNPLVIASCFQYSACFYIAMLGMLSVPSVQGKRFTTPMLFFTIGMATQIFDFYTAPLITFGLPALMLLLCRQQAARPAHDIWRLLGACFLSWFIGYAGAWLIKMLLTTVLTPYNALENGWNRLLYWLSPAHGEGGKWRGLEAVFYCTINIVDLLPLIIEGLLVALYVAALIKNRPHKRAFIDNLPYPAIALLPYIWFLVAANPTADHFYFQYRSLGMTLFGGLIFMLRTAGWDRLLSEKTPAA